METSRPIIGRGVLLDLAAAAGVQSLANQHINHPVPVAPNNSAGLPFDAGIAREVDASSLPGGTE